MNLKQKMLLKELENVLWKISEECEQDNDFNNEISDIDVWTKSVDEMAMEIKYFINE